MIDGRKALLGVAGAALLVLPALAQAGCTNGGYTAAQAATGKSLYNTHCAACHMTNLSGGSGPALSGTKFQSYLDFSKITAKQLLSFIKSQMPYQAPGSLKTDEYNAIFAHILKYNGYPSGSTELDDKSAACIKMLPYPGKS